MSIFNRWRKYPKKKPKESGWYTCTVQDILDPDKRKTMDLYFELAYRGRWIDTRRSTVFEGYKVYQPCRYVTEENRVWEDNLCDMTIWVLAWKKQEEPWMKGVGKKKNEKVVTFKKKNKK